jgi:hypothetical protein
VLDKWFFSWCFLAFSVLSWVYGCAFRLQLMVGCLSHNQPKSELYRLFWRKEISPSSVEFLIIILLMPMPFAVRASTLPLSPNLQAVLLAKIFMYEKKFKKSAAISVYVINAPLVTEAFSRFIGETGGHINIKLVRSGKGIPDEKFDLVYFNVFFILST